MDYSRFIALNAIILFSASTIYVGCRRSYSIYFFERDTEIVIFLEETGALIIPLVLSVIVVILYFGAKRKDAADEKESRASGTLSSAVQKITPAELIPISQSSVKGNGGVCNEMMAENDVRDGVSLDSLAVRKLASPKSSILDDHELAMERRRSQIYKEIGKISVLPFSLNGLLSKMTHSSTENISKHSLIDIVAQFISIYLPIWIGVIALHITLVEIFSNKLYYLFYYYHPGMKLIAMIISISLGLYHQFKWTWFINNILVITTSYVVVSRVETASYYAGFLFLFGMVLFDLFWTCAIDLLSTVLRQVRPPLMIIIPWGNEGKFEMISVVDIIVPGIFLNVILKFSEMYDAGAFLPPFYAVVSGLLVTLIIHVFRRKTTPAIVLPGIAAMLVSLLSVDNPYDLWQFEIKH
ncbi:unnamed protein product [Thelazia callipaeda]|uniref:Uncharacterized protein n=1 Tax=Thelazia callipaeda TaxID=103827 RepID=A0A0N5CZL5_THECL|nr:unnamed protein product [Thelazia callipaeda]